MPSIIALDENPLSDFTRPEPVFFGINGTPKNDALASAGAKAINVPSVWDAPEPPLRRALSAASPEFIVPDADWCTDDKVRSHATCRGAFLRRIGVNAHIAAAARRPEEALRHPTRQHEEVKGDDDLGDGYLGAGYPLDSLVILDPGAWR